MATFKKKDLEALAASGGVVLLLLQTAENDQPPESAGGFLRFFKRKTHPEDMASKLSFSVLALGDSNLLLDRQHTGAKDCNKCGQLLDTRLGELGATRFYDRGEVDERTGMTEVEPWVNGLWPALRAVSDATASE